jgi:hypothetical protein
MINYDLKFENDTYAGGLQDIYVMIIFGKQYKGTFVDIGCRHPVLHNNTYLLEKYGWKGLAVDLEYFTPEWKKERPNSKYLNCDAFAVNYEKEFKNLNLQSPIDFLSIDLEVSGERFNILNKVFETGYEFKTITIEHDAYCGFDETEKIPQRDFLQERGYILVKQCEWIEDFWINPKYISENKYEILKQVNSRDDEEVHPWTHLKNKGYDWTHFYKK